MVIVILGPTAVGKTKMSVEIAKKIKGEIINADSIQIYKELDIGSAKIKEEEKEGIKHQLDYADVNHCLSIEQVGEEVIEDFHIEVGTFDTISRCKYKIPSITDIGKLYQRLVIDTQMDETLEEAIYKVFQSFISDEISDFNSSVYYRSPDYLKYSYLEGELLLY